MTVQTLRSALVAASGGNGKGQQIRVWDALLTVAVGRAASEIVAVPAAVNLILYQGDDFTLRIDVTDEGGEPFDLAAYEAEAQIRQTADADDIAGAFVATIQEGNAIYLHLTSPVSAALPLACVWDVQITAGPAVTTLAAGTITLTREVTR